MEPKRERKKAPTLRQKLKECQEQRDQYLAGWQRARADFLNYKKEERAHLEEFLNYEKEGLILKVLPILDSFDLAQSKLPQNLKGDKYIKGLLQIKVQLQEFLKNQGIEEIKALGQKFDPSIHEVVEGVEVKNKKPGLVVEEVQKGYKWKGKLVRAAKVKISE